MTSPLIRLRMFIGLTTALHGLSGLLVDGYIKHLVQATASGVLWSWLLMIGGALMFWAAAFEACCHRRTWGSVTGVALLGCLWIAVGYHSLVDGRVDAITLVAPAYVIFCAWCWVAVASSQRRELLSSQKQPNAEGAPHGTA